MDLWRVEIWTNGQWYITKDRLQLTHAEQIRDALRRKGHAVRVQPSAIVINDRSTFGK